MKEIEKIKLERNISGLCLISFVDGLWFPFPVFIIFFLASGLSMTQIGLVLGASYATSIIFDIPSSIWADKYSRKFMLVLSSIAFTLLNVIIYWYDSFEMFFLAFCFNGIGTAFSTGILSAFLYDTLLSLKKEDKFEQAQSKMLKSFFAGRLIVSLAGVYIYFLDPKLPFLLSVLANLVCVIVSLRLKEPVREKSISRSFDQLKEGLNFLFKHKKICNTVIIFSAVGAIWDVLFNYTQPAMEASKIPVAYFGIVYLFVNIFGFLGASLYQRMRSKIDWKGIMILYLLIDLASSIFFGTKIAALVILSIALLTFSSGSFDIYIGSIVHKIVPSSHRATTLSIRSQIYMLLTIVFMYLVNIATDRSSISAGMYVSAFVVLLSLFSFIKTHYKKSEIFRIKKPIF